MNDEAAIEAAIAEFIRSYNSGDLEGVLAYYDDDLIKYRQGATAETKKDIATRLRQIFRNHDTHVEVDNDEITVSGEMAYTLGSYRVTLRPRGQADTITVDRRYLEVWHRKKGRWLVLRTMDNTA